MEGLHEVFAQASTCNIHPFICHSILIENASAEERGSSHLFYATCRDIRRRCAKAKDELSGNLHARLRYPISCAIVDMKEQVSCGVKELW